jgi:hypothetical protein
MSSDVTLLMDNSSTTNDLSLSPNNNLNDLYSTFETNSLSRSSSVDSSCSSNKNHLEAQTSSTNSKDSTIKVPYPVLSDHRDPSIVLILLQKETQTTSKKILDVLKQIEDCEKRLTSNSLSEKTKTSLKYQRIQRKQQLDALKKHERRVNLQIDYITNKTEIKGLEDEQQQQQQMTNDKNSDEYKQIEILAKKLRQKLDQMKVYMRTRNEQMKKIVTSKDNRKRPSSSSIASTSHSNKHFKPAIHHHHHHKPPVVRLASRLTNHPSKSHHPIQTPTVRFLNKTTDSTINSSSPTTPASSSSTLSPPLIASTSTEDVNNISNSLPSNKIPPILEDGEIDVEFDIDELFDEDSYSEKRQINSISKNES